jgi:hypothetical protein
MMPDAHEEGGSVVGLGAIIDFLIAFVLSKMEWLDLGGIPVFFNSLSRSI